MKVVKGKCSVCGKNNAECMESTVWFIIPFKVCQSCVSKAFRSFRKGV